MNMVPEAWQNDVTMTEEKKEYYRWSAFSMEPWDGPGRSHFQIQYKRKNKRFYFKTTFYTIYHRWIDNRYVAVSFKLLTIK